MSLVAACVPHYIIGIALAAGIFGFHMLCEGFFKVKSEIPGTGAAQTFIHAVAASDASRR